ncbi:ATPase AAA [Campylobacterota bacterium]|nr:ATPase AAA [Campylobacterota bacterium]
MPKFGSLQIAILAFALLILTLSFAISTPWYAPIVTLLAVISAMMIVFNERRMKIDNHSTIGEKQDVVDTSFLPVRSSVTFKQVAGLQLVRDELDEIVDFFKNPAKYRKFGVVLPRGVLLAGPPGVGKTLMAKAIAGEAGVPFFYASGSSFAHLYVGVGPKKVRELFANARRHAPSIVFIDEIDAVGKSRGGMRGDERENTLNQLLTEMDGFESGAQVVVLAATNRIEMLDDALLRPGRFDRRIEVGLPHAHDREQILAIVFGGKPHTLNLAKLAERTVGFSGAALAVLANEAALHAIKRNANTIEDVDVEAVKEKVISLKKSGELLDETTSEKLSRYQAAKAIVGKQMGLKFESVRLMGDFFAPQQGIVGEAALFASIAARLGGIALWQVTNESGVSFCETDIALAKQLTERYEQAFNATGREIKLLDEALSAAIANLNLDKVAPLAARLLGEESVSYDLF